MVTSDYQIKLTKDKQVMRAWMVQWWTNVSKPVVMMIKIKRMWSLMGCTSAFPLPLIQMNIEASMSKTNVPKIETRFVKSKQKHFKV